MQSMDCQNIWWMTGPSLLMSAPRNVLPYGFSSARSVIQQLLIIEGWYCAQGLFLNTVPPENMYFLHKPWSALHPFPTRQQCRRAQDPSFKGFQKKSIGDKRTTRKTYIGHLLIFFSEVDLWATYTRLCEMCTEDKEYLFWFSTLPKCSTMWKRMNAWGFLGFGFW